MLADLPRTDLFVPVPERTTCIYRLIIGLLVLAVIGLSGNAFLRGTYDSIVTTVNSAVITPLIVSLTVVLVTLQFTRLSEKSIRHEIERLLDEKGSIYFTGIVNKHIKKNIFNNLELNRYIELDNLELQTLQDTGSNVLETKILTIGLGGAYLPDELVSSMQDDINLGIKTIKYKILFTHDSQVSKTRIQSNLDDRYLKVDDYINKNIDQLKELLDDITFKIKDKDDRDKTKRDIFEGNSCVHIRQHETYPFGMMLAHRGAIWYTPIWNHRSSSEQGPLLEIVRQSAVGGQIEKSFNDIWDNSKPVNPDSVMNEGYILLD